MYSSLFVSLLGFWAVRILADPTPASTAMITPPPNKGYIGVGTFDSSTSLNGYGTFTCEAGTYTSSNNQFMCCDSSGCGQPATSCGGKGTATLFLPDGYQSACKSKETCHTNILFDDKQKKHSATEIQCRSDAKSATWTFYRSDPPAIKDGKSNAPGSGGEYAVVGAIFAGAFALGMAVML